MIPEISIKMTDFDQFDKEMSRFKQDIKTKARRAGLVEFAKPLKKTLKASINDRSGALNRSIGHASVRKGDKAALGLGVDDEALIVGSVRKAIGYEGGRQWQISKLRWLDQGTKRHPISPKNGGSLNIQGNLVSGEVVHPGVTARNVLRKAYQQHSNQFETLFSRGAVRALKRYGAKLA